MTLVDKALAVMGDRERIASGELRSHLLPGWRREYGDDMAGRQSAGYAVAQRLGVSPRQVKEEKRSYYYREDLLRASTPSVPREPTGPFCLRCQQHSSPGSTRCNHCGD
jgi:hypothetical protein